MVLGAGSPWWIGLVILAICVAVLAALATVVLWVIAIIDCAMWPMSAFKAADESKTFTALLLACFGPLGALVYWRKIRPRLRATHLGRW